MSFSPGNLIVSGTYNNDHKINYEVRVFPSNQIDGSNFGVIITNYERTLDLKFTQGSTNVVIQKTNSDGTYSDITIGIPVWIGDKIYSDDGNANNITSNSNGYIGTITAVTGTEGKSVTAFTLDAISGASVSGTEYAPCSYQAQIKDKPTTCTSHNADNEKFGSGKAYMHGLEFRFSGNMLSPPFANPASYHAFQFTAYPVKDFNLDKMVKVSKDNKHHVVGFDSSTKKLRMQEDVYAVESIDQAVPTNLRTFGYESSSSSNPTFQARGDDIYVGRGPNESPLYMGYPNIKQFGEDIGNEFIVTDGVLNVDTSVLPALEEFVLPNASAGDSTNLNIDLTSANQLIVGYVRNSNYLVKGKRSLGIESSLNIGGRICGLYLDHKVNNEVWVLYDNVSCYSVVNISINASGTAMAINENRIYNLTGDTLITPFDEETVKLTDILVQDNFVYVLASSSNYYDSNASWKSKCFGTGDIKKEYYLWRSASVATAPSAIPDIGYSTLAMTNITSGFKTEADSSQSENAFWIGYTQTENVNSSSGQGQTSWTPSLLGGNQPEFRLNKAPHPKGLVLWGNYTGEESVGVAIPYVESSFSSDERRQTAIEYESTTESSGSETVTVSKWKAGPFIKHVNVHILASHIEVYHDAESFVTDNNSSYAGIKRVPFNTSSQSTLETREYKWGGMGAQNSITITAAGTSAQMTGLRGINTFINTTSGKRPKGIALIDKDSVRFFDASLTATLNSNDIDGQVYLNNSFSGIKRWTLDINNLKPASQTLNLNGSNFSWIPVTTSDAFKAYYIDNPSNASETTDWSQIDVLSVINISVGNGSSETDITNLLPDETDKTDNAHFYKIFYRVSLMYDGYQESELGESVYSNSGTNPNKFGHEVTVEVKPDKLPKRLSHINIYRGKAFNSSATDADLDYVLVKSLPVDGAGWSTSSNAGFLKYVIKDQKGANFGSYEANTGISPAMQTVSLNYGLSEQCAGYLFVSDANNYEISNVSNYIFRSKPGKYSIFNWANEYCALPEKPTALKSYNNLLYAFTPSAVYTINPNNLSIVDKMEGAGCLSEDSVIATDYGMFFADKYGVYMHNGKAGRVITHPIHSSDNSDLTNYTWDNISTSLESSPPKLAFDGERKALLVIFDVSNNSYAWIYSVLSRRWDFWSFTNKIKAVTQGKYGEVLASDGKLLQIATNSTRKPWQFETKKITGGFDSLDKSFTEVHTEGTTGLDIKYKTSSISSLQSLNSNRLSSSYKKAKWLQIRVEDSNGTRKLESIGVHLRPIKAKSTKI